MILVIDTQFMENYGAHDWDGEGACPQYWKFKGGSCYKVRNVNPFRNRVEDILALVRGEIEKDNDYVREYILGTHWEAGNWLSDFERSQQEYEGQITYAEPELDYAELKAIFDHEYAEWCADQDAIHYGA